MRVEIKAKLHQIVDEKTQYLQDAIADLRASNTDTKSSMGDKYETSREMLQQEIMRLQQQLANLKEQKSVLQRMRNLPTSSIRFGSLVSSSAGNFVIAISLGRITVFDTEYIAISEETPLAKQLIGKTTEDSFVFQDKEARIFSVN